jgi:TonB-linked SusC/RagA family outer membrane protein
MPIFTRSLKNLLMLSLVVCAVPVVAQQDAARNPEAADSTVTNSARKYSGFKVTGTVVSAVTGLPLPNINISIPDYAAALTDEQGHFRLDVPSFKVTVAVWGQDYQLKQVPLRGLNAITVALHDKPFPSVYESVSLPTGPVTKSQVPFAVTTLNPGGSWEQPLAFADDYLQGKVSGMDVIRRSGTAGQGAAMLLHGFNSLNSSNSPLFVIDGMVYDNHAYGTSLISGHINNPLAHIDVKDIDNITIIKDGAALYGTKGANGVVLVTTAHANELATKIDFAAYGGINFAPKNLPVLNSRDFRLYLSDVLKSSGLSDAQIQGQPYMNDSPDNPEYYRYHSQTNWQDQVLGDSHNQNYYLKVTGGDNIAKYALSMGYLEGNGLIKETNLKRYSTRFNADLNLSPRLTATTSLAFTSSEQDLRNQGLDFNTNPLLTGLVKAPFLRVQQVTDEGIESPNLADTDIFSRSNPASLIDKVKQQDQNYRFFGSVKFNYALHKYGSVNTLIGLTFDRTRENSFIPRLGVMPEELDNAMALSRLGNRVQRYFSIYNDTYYAYQRSWSGGHSLVGMAGFRFNNLKSEEDRAYGYNSPTDDFTSVGTGANALRHLTGDIGEARWLNSYLSANYSWLSKYLLSVNVSVDGSSRFGSQVPDAFTVGGNKLAVLPAVAAGWLISSENFMAALKPLDLLKLRLTYGLSGNDDIGNYTARQYYVSQNLFGAQGTVRGNIANLGIKWETTTKTSVGLDAALFQERLSLTVDVYQNKTTDMLVYEPVPVATGFGYVVSNNGGMQNQGIDISLVNRVIDKALKLDLGLTFSSYRNQITTLPGNRLLTDFAGATMLTEVGKPANQFYGYQTNGIYRTEAEAASTNYSTRLPNGTLAPFRGGDVKFVDLNNDHIIDDQDRTVIGDANPDFLGSLSGSVSWERLSLNALFTFRSGSQVYNAVRANLEALSALQNQTTAALNRWQYDGQDTRMPRAHAGDPLGNARFSDRWIEDGSYIRLRTLSVSYALPVKTAILKNASVYASASNLFTSTKYLGYDPEFSAAGSPLAQGIDIGMEPQARSVHFGVRIGL